MDHAFGHSYALASWIFLRLLGLIYFAAFFSFAVQIKGLIGEQGILPISEYLRKPGSWDLRPFFSRPTLCWISTSDRFLSFICWGGVAFAGLLVIGMAPLPVMILLWIFYLSLYTAGRIFSGYQWDVLLLEAGFLAIFLAPLELLPSLPPVHAPSPVIIWLLWWLLFRLMFSSGITKLMAGDRHWRNGEALRLHYETQPLPTPISWWAHQLPAWFHRLSTAVTLTIEIVAPFLIAGPIGMKIAAAIMFILLMLLIELTGNYAYFNLLTIALCVPLFDDASLARWFHIAHWMPNPPAAGSVHLSFLPAALVIFLSPAPLFLLFQSGFSWPKWLQKFAGFLTPFRFVNSYGLFSVMTIERPEILFEGSHDGREWKSYELKYQPDDPMKPPRFVAPHQPRLDWQLWFAAMGYYQNHTWVGQLLTRLSEGSIPVEKLFRSNPFPNDPPRYVRSVMYDYRFTNFADRKKSGAWWRRERRGLYSPEMARGVARRAKT